MTTTTWDAPLNAEDVQVLRQRLETSDQLCGRLADALEALGGDWTDTYCEFCQAHAPKHLGGPRDGLPCGAIPHFDDCPRALAEEVLREAGRRP